MRIERGCFLKTRDFPIWLSLLNILKKKVENNQSEDMNRQLHIKLTGLLSHCGKKYIEIGLWPRLTVTIDWLSVSSEAKDWCDESETKGTMVKSRLKYFWFWKTGGRVRDAHGRTASSESETVFIAERPFLLVGDFFAISLETSPNYIWLGRNLITLRVWKIFNHIPFDITKKGHPQQKVAFFARAPCITFSITLFDVNPIWSCLGLQFIAVFWIINSVRSAPTLISLRKLAHFFLSLAEIVLYFISVNFCFFRT